MRPALVVWCPPDADAATHALVTDADRARSSRFRHAVDAWRHLTGRVLARRAGALWLAAGADDVLVGVEPHGRPLLVDGAGRTLPAHVSITHAGGLVGVAVAGEPVGLDVEEPSAISGLLDSPVIWTPAELADLASTALAERLSTAATWWTAKEAVLKSRGRGLLDPAHTLEVRSSTVPWHSLAVDAHHAAAIAGPAPGRQVWLGRAGDSLEIAQSSV